MKRVADTASDSTDGRSERPGASRPATKKHSQSGRPKKRDEGDGMGLDERRDSHVDGGGEGLFDDERCVVEVGQGSDGGASGMRVKGKKRRSDHGEDTAKRTKGGKKKKENRAKETRDHTNASVAKEKLKVKAKSTPPHERSKDDTAKAAKRVGAASGSENSGDSGDVGRTAPKDDAENISEGIAAAAANGETKDVAFGESNPEKTHDDNPGGSRTGGVLAGDEECVDDAGRKKGKESLAAAATPSIDVSEDDTPIPPTFTNNPESEDREVGSDRKETYHGSNSSIREGDDERSSRDEKRCPDAATMVCPTSAISPGWVESSARGGGICFDEEDARAAVRDGRMGSSVTSVADLRAAVVAESSGQDDPHADDAGSDRLGKVRGTNSPARWSSPKIPSPQSPPIRAAADSRRPLTLALKAGRITRPDPPAAALRMPPSSPLLPPPAAPIPQRLTISEEEISNDEDEEEEEDALGVLNKERDRMSPCDARASDKCEHFSAGGGDRGDGVDGDGSVSSGSGGGKGLGNGKVTAANVVPVLPVPSSAATADPHTLAAAHVLISRLSTVG